MTSLPWETAEDYEIMINDVVDNQYTGEYITLGSSDDSFCSVRFDSVGSPDLDESTYNVSGGDGIQFNIERYRGINWTINGGIHSGSVANAPGEDDKAWNSWSRLYRAWVSYPGRNEARSVVPLFVKRPGRDQMVVYGRPRRIDPDTQNSHSGFISYTALFKQSDPTFYSAKETIETVTLSQSSSAGGFLYVNTQDAFILPFVTTSSDRKVGVTSQEGDVGSHPSIRINGPVTNPKIIFYGTTGVVLWTFSLDLEIFSNTWIDIDARQWHRSVTDRNGTSYAGYYSGSKIQDIVVPPGLGTFDFLGDDPTGTSTCQLQYRNAWSST